MNDRKEPTISGIRPDPEDAARQRARAQAQQGARAAQAPAPRQQVVVKKSGLATFAFLLALVASGAAGFLYYQFTLAQQELVRADERLRALEESLKLTDSESAQSVSAIHESLQEHFKQIDLLWANYRKHESSIVESEKQIAAAKKIASEASSKASSEIKSFAAQFDTQKNALALAEKESANLAAQARALNEKIARLERSLSDLGKRIDGTEKEFESINAFRRTINQQILELRSAAAGVPAKQ